MAVEWVDPDTFAAVVGDGIRAADFNSVVQDLKYIFDPPRCAVRLTGAQNVANTTDHSIDWDEAVYDSHGDMFDVGSPSVVTITRDGMYSIGLSNLWDDDDTDGIRAAALYVNGSIRRDFYKVGVDNVDEFALSTTFDTNLLDGDELEVIVRQSSGSTRQLIQTRTVLTVRWSAAPP